MRKFILLLSCIVPLLAACSKEQLSSQPCSFDVKITEIKGTKMRFTITPSNPEAYYTYRLLADYEEAFKLTGQTLLDNQMEFLLGLFDLFGEYENKNHDFADIFCYRGTTNQVEMMMERERTYKLVVFQVNPWKKEGLGLPKEVLVTTPNPRTIDLSFQLEFHGDTLRIHPSDAEATYFWGYESKEIVVEEYVSPVIYFYSVIDMYEQYGFMNSMLSKGDVEWVFPRDDNGIPAGREWYLMAAGYHDGDINSDDTVISFTWSPGESRITDWLWPLEDYEN